MKIKQIGSILKASKTIIVLETPSYQWLGDGHAFYPIYGLPILNEDNIFALFDIPTEKKDKFFFQKQEPYPHLSFADFDKTEHQLEQDIYAINDGSCQLLMFIASTGVLFLPENYLKPISDEKSVTLYERTNEHGHTYIVAKRGMNIIGLFEPYKIYDNNFFNTLHTVSAMCLKEQGDEE